jgi:hypothetical protein
MIVLPGKRFKCFLEDGLVHAWPLGVGTKNRIEGQNWLKIKRKKMKHEKIHAFLNHLASAGLIEDLFLH